MGPVWLHGACGLVPASWLAVSYKMPEASIIKGVMLGALPYTLAPGLCVVAVAHPNDDGDC